MNLLPETLANLFEALLLWRSHILYYGWHDQSCNFITLLASCCQKGIANDHMGHYGLRHRDFCCVCHSRPVPMQPNCIRVGQNHQRRDLLQRYCAILRQRRTEYLPGCFHLHFADAHVVGNPNPTEAEDSFNCGFRSRRLRMCDRNVALKLSENRVCLERSNL